MAQQYISINRGKEGFNSSDITAGTATVAGDDIELRFNDAASLTKLDITKALAAFERYVQSALSVVPPI